MDILQIQMGNFITLVYKFKALVFQEMMMVVNLATNHSHDEVGTAAAAAVVVVAVAAADEVVEDFGGKFVDHFGYKLEETEKRNLGVIFVPIPLKYWKQRGMVMTTTWMKHYPSVLLDSDGCAVLRMLSSQLLDLGMISPPSSSQCTSDLCIYNSSCIVYKYTNNISTLRLMLWHKYGIVQRYISCETNLWISYIVELFCRNCCIFKRRRKPRSGSFLRIWWPRTNLQFELNF